METLKDKAEIAAAKAAELAGAMKAIGGAMQAGSASIKEFTDAVNAYSAAELYAKAAKDVADRVIND